MYLITLQRTLLTSLVIFLCFVFCDTVLILFSISMALRQKISDHKLLDCRSVTVNKTSKPLFGIRRTNFQSFPVNLKICSSFFAFATITMRLKKLSRHDHQDVIAEIQSVMLCLLSMEVLSLTCFVPSAMTSQKCGHI